MKKNISINLFGTLYSIDDDAYSLLERYLQSMKSYFSRQEGGEEIADDIEHRVAELLWQEKEKGAEAVNIEMIKNIMSKIGDPAQIDNEANKAVNGSKSNDDDKLSQGLTGQDLNDNASSGSASLNTNPDADNQNVHGTYTTAYDKMKSNLQGKRLYRDPMNKMLGGVCAGLSKYFGGDVTIWRLAICLLTLAFWFFDSFPALLLPLFYFILWIILPVANTPEDRLRMKGLDVTPQNLNEEIINGAYSNTSQAYSSSPSNNNDGCLKVLGGGCLAMILLPFLVLLLGLFLLAPLFSGLISGGLFEVIPDATEEGFLVKSVMMNLKGIFWALAIMIVLIFAIPIFFLARLMNTDRKPLNTATTVCLVLLWFVSLIGGIYFISQSIGKISKDAIEYESHNDRDIDYIDENGIFYSSDEEREWVKQNGWTILSNDDCEGRCTYKGQSLLGDYDERYLDAHNNDKQMKYTAEQSECVEPGYYKLRVLTRSKEFGAFIFAKVGSSITADDQDHWQHLQSIPSYNDANGPIWEWATDKKTEKEANIPYDMVERKAEIADTHDGQGYGWAYTIIDSIPVNATTNVYYGVTTDRDITKENANCVWFSATNFVLERIGDIK